MADMTKDQEARLNLASSQWWGGHARNFARSMDPRNKEPMEQVAPWGEARAAAIAPPATVGPALTGGGGTPERPQDAQQPNVPTLSNQSKMAVAGGAQAGPPAAWQQQAFRSLLGNGLTMTGDMQGNRTYTMGTHGQDGYGRMVVPGGQNAMAAQNLVGGRPQAQSPYSFEGSPEDRARFMRQPTRPAMQNGNAVSPQRAAFLQQYGGRNNGGAGMEAPKYLGPESGLGWKTRLAKYNAELDAYEKLTGQKTDMDIAAMREAGAGRQSELQAQGVNDANDIARQRLVGDQQGNALDMQAKQLEIQSLQQRREIENRLNATTDPNERRALQAQLLALQGKDSAQKYQIVTREEIDPVTQMPIKTPIAVNQDDPSQSFVVRGQGGQRQLAQMPNDKKLMVKGQDYDTPRGPATWDGSRFIPLQ